MRSYSKKKEHQENIIGIISAIARNGRHRAITCSRQLAKQKAKCARIGHRTGYLTGALDTSHTTSAETFSLKARVQTDFN